MNNDLISREALKKAISEATYNFEQIPIRVDKVQEIIDNAPIVDAYTIDDVRDLIGLLEKRPTGEWIKQYNKSYELITNEGILVGEFTKCPKCQYDKARGSNFCPNCGAKMGNIK